MEPDAYARLIALLDGAGADYRLLAHSPEGRTEAVSAMRGNELGAAAKCMVLMLKHGKRRTSFVLAVVPGDRRVSFAAVRELFGASYVSFAVPAMAEALAGSVAGTILPFSFDQRLQLVVDPDLLEHDELFFNAARLERSVALATSDYLRLASPRLASITERDAEADPTKEEPNGP